MTNMELISNLKKEATEDTVFNDVLHVFAMRERTRKDVTVQSLAVNMQKAGFNYTPQQLSQALDKLAKLGFGKVEKDTKGRVRALRDIRVTLQSLGSAAAQKAAGENIKAFKSRNRFGKLSAAEEAATVDPTPVSVPERLLKNAVILTLMINDKPVNVQVPKGLSPAELASLITKLQR